MDKEKELQKQQGERLRAYRKTLKISQKELSSFLGIDQSFISSIERGEKSISMGLINRMAIGPIVKKVNYNWLITGQGPMLLDHTETTGEVNEPEQNYDPVSREEKEALEAQVRALEEKMKKLDKLEEQFAQLLQRLDNKD